MGVRTFKKNAVTLTEDAVSQNDVEHGGERPADVVKRNANVLQAEVVESDHQNEHDRQWHDLLEHKRGQLSFGLVSAEELDGRVACCGCDLEWVWEQI